MKSAEEIMKMLDAYDLTGSLRDAGELAGCSHHNVEDNRIVLPSGEVPESNLAPYICVYASGATYSDRVFLRRNHIINAPNGYAGMGLLTGSTTIKGQAVGNITDRFVMLHTPGSGFAPRGSCGTRTSGRPPPSR